LMEELQEKGRLEGIEKGRLEGRLEGIEQNKREMAVNLLKLNMPKEQIAFVTGLSIKELSELEAKIQ